MSASTQHPESESEAIVTTSQLKRERLRLRDVTFTRTPSGHGHASVELEWLDGLRVVGTADGQSSSMADLRLSALAAIGAIENFSEGRLRFELVGVKAMRVFDANIVIVSLQVLEGADVHRLLGSHLTEGDAVRSSAIAVLNATNRLLGNYIATR